MADDELLFFAAKPAALPLYEAFRDAVLSAFPEARIEMKNGGKHP